jgi:Transposase, Mutator family
VPARLMFPAACWMPARAAASCRPARARCRVTARSRRAHRQGRHLLGVSTRRVENLSASLGVTGLSKSQVSAMAAELDEMVEGFRSRRLDGGPWMALAALPIAAVTSRLRMNSSSVPLVSRQVRSLRSWLIALVKSDGPVQILHSPTKTLLSSTPAATSPAAIPHERQPGRSASSPQAEDHPTSSWAKSGPAHARTPNRALQDPCPGGTGFRHPQAAPRAATVRVMPPTWCLVLDDQVAALQCQVRISRDEHA